MAEPKHKQDRKALLKSWKAEQRAKARANLPLPNDQLQAIFDMLDAELPHRGCDKTLRLVREWCDQHNVTFAPVDAWLIENGGCCDCEALSNAEPAYLEAIKDEI